MFLVAGRWIKNKIIIEFTFNASKSIIKESYLRTIYPREYNLGNQHSPFIYTILHCLKVSVSTFFETGRFYLNRCKAEMPLEITRYDKNSMTGAKFWNHDEMQLKLNRFYFYCNVLFDFCKC